MTLETPVSEAHVRRVLAEVEAGQVTAGAVVTEADREIARRQVRGELSADEAVREAIAAALDRSSPRYSSSCWSHSANSLPSCRRPPPSPPSRASMAKQDRAITTRENIVQTGARLFAQKHYESVRMAELLTEAGITQGGFYFHFPEGKKTVAEEIIARQDGRFTELRDAAIADTSLDGLSALIMFLQTVVNEIENNVVMRAGLRLVTQASEHFPEVAHMPHPSWNDAIEAALKKAEAEGSLRPDVDTTIAARGLVLLFIGAQTSSFINDQWESVTDLANTLVDFLRTSIAADGFVPAAQRDDA